MLSTAAMIDRRIMPEEERKVLIQMLDEIDPGARYSVTLKEEVIDAYDTRSVSSLFQIRSMQRDLKTRYWD